MFFFRCLSISPLTVAVLTLGCGLAARAQLSVPPLTSAAPVGVPGDIEARGVNTGFVLLMSQIAQGQLTPQQAWEQKLLSADDILQLLSRPQRLTQDGSNEDLKRDLAGLLVSYAPETVATPDELSARVRLELCHYYSEQGDERAVPLCEALIAEKLDGKQIQMPTGAAAEPDNASLWLGGVIYLAQYYEKVGQWQKAGETWERALTFWQDVSWWQAGVRIDAARAYKQTGTPENQEKAAQLYAKVSDYGNAWDTVMARYDHAQPLLQEGKLDEAQAILSAPLKLDERSEFAVIAQNTWLASIAYRKGDLDDALRLSKIAVDAGEGVALTNAPVRGLYSMAQDTYTRAGGWRKQPIQTDTKEVVFQANPSQPDQPLYARFRIKTYGDTSITASVDNPNIQARVLPVNNWQRAGLNAHEEEMEVIIQSSSLNKFKDVPLVLSSATRGKTTTVRLSLVEKSA